MQIAVIKCCQRIYALGTDKDKDRFISNNIKNHAFVEYHQIDDQEVPKRYMCKNCISFKIFDTMIYPEFCNSKRKTSAQSRPGEFKKLHFSRTAGNLQ